MVAEAAAARSISAVLISVDGGTEGKKSSDSKDQEASRSFESTDFANASKNTQLYK